jgi:hypothetical protein
LQFLSPKKETRLAERGRDGAGRAGPGFLLTNQAFASLGFGQTQDVRTDWFAWLGESSLSLRKAKGVSIAPSRQRQRSVDTSCLVRMPLPERTVKKMKKMNRN